MAQLPSSDIRISEHRFKPRACLRHNRNTTCRRVGQNRNIPSAKLCQHLLNVLWESFDKRIILFLLPIKDWKRPTLLSQTRAFLICIHAQGVVDFINDFHAFVRVVSHVQASNRICKTVSAKTSSATVQASLL